MAHRGFWRGRWTAALLAAAMCWPVPAETSGRPDDGPPLEKTLSPYFFVKDGDPSVDRLPLESTHVRAEVAGVVADVHVLQTYKNAGTRPINAVYVFPASIRAAVHGMTMKIGKVVVRAKLKEKEKARKEFEAAKKAGKSATLLEQERPNVFRMSVSNVMPGDRIEVDLHYSELLVPTSGIYEFLYPTVAGPRYSEVPEAGAPASEGWLKSPYTKAGEPPSYEFSIEAKLSAGMPVESLRSPSHKIAAKWKDPSEVEVSLSETERSGGDRDFILHYRLTGGKIRSGLVLQKGEDENFFLLMVQPPRRVLPETIPPREFVFVVDVSGSMRGFPLDTAKSLLRGLIGDLRPSDRFNVLFFSGGSSLMSPESVSANPRNIGIAARMIDGRQGGGGTRLLEALKRAMALPRHEGWSRSFIVVTDGYIAAERGTFEYIRGHLGDANVYAFGIGSSVNRYLIEGVAKAGLGEPFFVTDPSFARRQAASFKHYVESPLMTDVCVTFDGFDAYDVEPQSLPDVLAGRPIIVHGKWRGLPKGALTVSGTTGAGPYRKRFRAQKARIDKEGSALRCLWARTRLSEIADFADPGELEKLRGEIVRLGLKYDLLTRFTSFIAVYDVVRSREGAARDVKQPLPMPKGVPDTAIGVEVGAEPGLWLLALCLCGLLLVRRRWGRV